MVYAFLVIALFAGQIWDDNQGVKILESQDLEDASRWATSRVHYSLGNNDLLSDALQMRDSEKNKLETLRNELDEKITELEGEDFAPQLIAEQWREFFASAKLIFGEESKKRFEILTQKLSLDSVRREPLDFEYPILLKDVSELNTDEVSKLRFETTSALRKYHEKRNQLIGDSMEEVLLTLSQTARKRFRQLVGGRRVAVKVSRTPLTLDTIDNTKKAILSNLIKHEDSVPELELVDDQKVKLENLLYLVDEDPRYNALSEATLEYERAGLEVPDNLIIQYKREEDRVVEWVSQEVEKMLLPHQKLQLNAAAAQTYLLAKQNDALPFEWPGLLADELGLSDAESEKLAKSTSEAGERFAIEIREFVAELNRKVFDGVPEKMKDDLDRLKSLLNFSSDKLTPIPLPNAGSSRQNADDSGAKSASFANATTMRLLSCVWKIPKTKSASMRETKTGRNELHSSIQ